MKANVPGFEDAAGTVEFISKVDRIFNFLNSSSVWAEGYKTPVSLHNINYWNSIVEETTKYFKHLTDSSGTLLVHHRRKTFLRGFILTSSAVL